MTHASAAGQPSRWPPDEIREFAVVNDVVHVLDPYPFKVAGQGTAPVGRLAVHSRRDAGGPSIGYAGRKGLLFSVFGPNAAADPVPGRFCRWTHPEGANPVSVVELADRNPAALSLVASQECRGSYP